MIPHVFFQFSFNGDNWKIGIYNRKGIPQKGKMMKIRISFQIASVKLCLSSLWADLVCPWENVMYILHISITLEIPYHIEISMAYPTAR